MNYNVELSSHFFVNFKDEENTTREKILWGIIAHNDNKKCFDEDNYVSTSSIIEVVDSEFIVTQGNVYKVQKGTGETIDLPNTDFTHELLQNGFSPLIITKLYDFSKNTLTSQEQQ